MKHFADPDFWILYGELPEDIRVLADKNFEMLKSDPRYASIRLKKVGILYAARVGLHYRALARERPDGLHWFWIGHHSTYDRLLKML